MSIECATMASKDTEKAPFGSKRRKTELDPMADTMASREIGIDSDGDKALAIIGTEDGGTIVYVLDNINPDLYRFLCLICIAAERPMLSDGTTWIQPSQAVEDFMVQRLGRHPDNRQKKFLDDLETFRHELYMPDKFIRPSQRSGGTKAVQDHVIHRRVAAYFRHTRDEPVREADKERMFNFVWEFVRGLAPPLASGPVP